jgi:hypothetical protein
MGAVPLFRARRPELATAGLAEAVMIHVAAAVGVERRGAVRADDPEVLEPMIVANAVDVIQDQ